MDGPQTELVPITTKAAWDGMPIYEILSERLSRLERVLVAQGFEDPVPRPERCVRNLELFSKDLSTRNERRQLRTLLGIRFSSYIWRVG